MTPEQILADIAAGQQLIAAAVAAYAAIKADLDAATQAQIDAQIASSGAALDAVRATLDADAA